MTEEENRAEEAIAHYLQFAKEEFNNLKKNAEKCDIYKALRSYKAIYFHLDHTAEYIFKTKNPFEKTKEMLALEKDVEDFIKNKFPSKCECIKTPLISPYEENWGQWWDGIDLNERKEVSKGISVRPVSFFKLTEEEKEKLRSYALDKGII